VFKSTSLPADADACDIAVFEPSDFPVDLAGAGAGAAGSDFAALEDEEPETVTSFSILEIVDWGTPAFDNSETEL